MSDSTLSTFTAVDGDNLAVQDWYVPSRAGVRATVIVVHGLGEHIGRYENVAQQLNRWGFSVRGYDQHGHGRSGGARGSLPTPTRLLDDLADMVDSVRLRRGRGMPIVILGHGMGAVVAARFVYRSIRSVQGLVLVSPSFAPRMGWLRRLAIDLWPSPLQGMSVGTGIRTSRLCHDSRIVRAYREDPYVHRRMSVRLARFLVDSGAAMAARAPKWKTPTLVLYGGADGLTDPGVTRRFAAEAPPGVVSAVCFDAMYHELFHEARREAVYEQLRDWLVGQFPPLPLPPVSGPRR
jgi:alpha-beta hydrolase superfamily lysophospholipase